MTESLRMRGRPSRATILEWEDEPEKQEKRLSDPSKQSQTEKSSDSLETSSTSLKSFDDINTRKPDKEKKTLFRTKSTSTRPHGLKVDNIFSKKLDPIQEKKPEVPMYVSDSWMMKWMKGSEDGAQEWLFGYQNPKTGFFVPIEISSPMELALYEATTKELGSIPVQLVLNGHTIRLFRTEEAKPDVKVIITFNLKEVTITYTKGNNKDTDRLLIISRFHGRVFILQNIIGSITIEPSISIENLYIYSSINSVWARKFSTLVYPQQLVSILWKDKPYQPREVLVYQKNVGWATYGGSSVYVKTDNDLTGQIELHKNEEENKAKQKVRLEGSEVVPVVNGKSKGISFTLTWQKKKETLVMNEIATLEIVVSLKEESSTTIQDEVDKLITKYETAPIPIEYKIYPTLYTSLKEEKITIVSLPKKMLSRLSESRAMAIDAESQSEFNTVVDSRNQGDIASELVMISDRLNAIEEKLSKHSQFRGDKNTTENTQPKDILTTILERINSLEEKVNSLSKNNSDLRGSQGRHRKERRDSMESKLKLITNMLETKNSDGTKNSRVDVLEIRLARVFSYLTKKDEFAPTTIPKNLDHQALISVKLEEMETKFSTKQEVFEEKLDRIIELVKKNTFEDNHGYNTSYVETLKTSCEEDHKTLETKMNELSTRMLKIGSICQLFSQKLKNTTL